MGWRADEAYDRAQRQEFRDRLRALTWAEWLRWQAGRHWAFALGAGGLAVAFWLLIG